MSVAFTVTPTGVTFVLDDGVSHTFERTHPNFDLVKEALQEEDLDS